MGVANIIMGVVRVIMYVIGMGKGRVYAMVSKVIAVAPKVSCDGPLRISSC